MSKYTTEVRYICEVEAGLVHSEGYLRTADIIEKARPKVFDFDYPIFDTEYKPVLETKILKHFYTREIGLETYGLWKLKLDTKLNEIMPFYNQLYADGLTNINPFLTVNMSKSYEKQGDTTNKENTLIENSENTQSTQLQTDKMTGTVQDAKSETGTRTDNLSETTSGTRTDNLSEANNRTITPNTTTTATDSGTEGVSKTSALKNTRYDLYSDTPQGGLTGVNSETYLTNARKTTDDGTGSTASDTTTFGKVVTTRATGTETDNTTKTNTGTQQNSGSKTNTGTQQNSVSGTTTRTHNTTDTLNNSINGSKTGLNNIGKNGSVNSLENYIEKLKGRNGNIDLFDIADKIRNCILNIDVMIIEDLDCLFMGLW